MSRRPLRRCSLAGLLLRLRCVELCRRGRCWCVCRFGFGCGCGKCRCGRPRGELRVRCFAGERGRWSCWRFSCSESHRLCLCAATAAEDGFSLLRTPSPAPLLAASATTASPDVASTSGTLCLFGDKRFRQIRLRSLFYLHFVVLLLLLVYYLMFVSLSAISSVPLVFNVQSKCQ